MQTLKTYTDLIELPFLEHLHSVGMSPPPSRAQTDRLRCSTESGVNFRVGLDLLAERLSRFSNSQVILLTRTRSARELRSACGLGACVGRGFFRLERDL